MVGEEGGEEGGVRVEALAGLASIFWLLYCRSTLVSPNSKLSI